MPVDGNQIRTFLVSTPKPSKILVTSIDDEQKEVVPPKGVGGVTWAQVARSIETLNPAVIELFDKDDKLLRAQRFDGTVKGDAAPELPAVLARDAEAARLALFAQLIANAYKFSVDTSFTKLLELFERLDRRQELVEARLERTEGSYRRVMQQQIDDALEDAEQARKDAEAQASDPIGGIVQEFVGGIAAAKAGAAPNGKGKT